MEPAIYTTGAIGSSDTSTGSELDQHHGNAKLAVASDSAGPTAVATSGGVPPFRETQGDVKKVTRLIAEAQRAGANG